jgi:hypothetical protein
VQVWARVDDDDWIAGMRNPPLRVAGGSQKGLYPEGNLTAGHYRRSCENLTRRILTIT